MLVVEPFERSAESEAAALGALRSVDIAGEGDEGALVVVLPETAHAAEVPARRLIDALGGATFLTADAKMRSVLDLVRRLAASDLSVIVTGETGAGKEVVSSLLHACSARKDGPFVAVSCAAIAESLLESELFGHERGAFTGAQAAKAGLFEAAHGGTLFLDEIGECSPAIQAKLLRALETKRVLRVGSVVEREVDVRVVCATNRDLAELAQAGRFRSDLYFRLGAATVVVPPLRDRPLDVPLLARAFLEQARARLGRPPLAIAPAAMRKLQAHTWPGNVRELRNAMEYAAATAEGDTLDEAHLPKAVMAAPWARAPEGAPREPASSHATLYDEIRALERARIEEALRTEGGVRVRAAERLGLPLRTLTTKVREYRLGAVVPHARRAAE